MIHFRQILADEQGATIVEFAMVLPVLLVMIIGLFDVGMNIYTTSIIQGTMQKAGRDFSLEGPLTRQAGIENYITDQIRVVAPGADIVFERDAYFDFSDIGLPEPFDDINGDGECNEDEPFEDINGNGVFDLDRGEAGFGGARDAVLFNATVSYDRLFPIDAFLPIPERVTIEASTVLRNQPFDDQDRSFGLGTCAR